MNETAVAFTAIAALVEADDKTKVIVDLFRDDWVATAVVLIAAVDLLKIAYESIGSPIPLADGLRAQATAYLAEGGDDRG